MPVIERRHRDEERLCRHPQTLPREAVLEPSHSELATPREAAVAVEGRYYWYCCARFRAARRHFRKTRRWYERRIAQDALRRDRWKNVLRGRAREAHAHAVRAQGAPGRRRVGGRHFAGRERGDVRFGVRGPSTAGRRVDGVPRLTRTGTPSPRWRIARATSRAEASRRRARARAIDGATRDTFHHETRHRRISNAGTAHYQREKRSTTSWTRCDLC